MHYLGVTMFIIVSAQLPDLSPLESQLRHAALRADIKDRGYTFLDVQGCYNGESEDSFLILQKRQVPGNLSERLLLYVFGLGLIERYGQESMLVVGDDGQATLEFSLPVMPSRAPAHDSWRTYDGIPLGKWHALADGEPLPNAYTKIGDAVFVCGPA